MLNQFTNSSDSSNLLLIDSNREFKFKEAKHLYKELLKGQIWILFVPSVKIYFVRFTGSR